MSKDARYRNWVFVAYPESAPENWRLVYRGVLSMWAERNIVVDGSRILAYCLLMSDGSIVRVDTSDWLLVEVKSADDLEHLA